MDRTCQPRRSWLQGRDLVTERVGIRTRIERVMMEQITRDPRDEDAAALFGTQASIVCLEKLLPFTAPICLPDEGVNSESPRWRENPPAKAALDAVGRPKPQQNLTGSSVPGIRRDLAQIWRLMLALQIDEALRMIGQPEPRLDDVAPARALEKRDLHVGCGLAVELAEMLAAREETREADALFFRTVEAAAVAALYQVFLEGEPGSSTLLRRAYARTVSPASMDREALPFLGSLLSRWDVRYGGSPPEQPSGRISSTLTPRERNVLAMISQGFGNKRIARALKISPETVKSHVKGIFSKLAVSTRSEAVFRAGSRGLL
jgi:DNA-binding CsgD family transcriptional regulator